jgi:hypothetical protein
MQCKGEDPRISKARSTAMQQNLLKLFNLLSGEHTVWLSDVELCDLPGFIYDEFYAETGKRFEIECRSFVGLKLILWLTRDKDEESLIPFQKNSRFDLPEHILSYEFLEEAFLHHCFLGHLSEYDRLNRIFQLNGKTPDIALEISEKGNF